jgi:hypothetical protein
MNLRKYALIMPNLRIKRNEQYLNEYDIALSTRNFEIGLFWQRSNYFLVLNTAIATGSLLAFKEAKILSIVLTVFGILVSLLWYGINLGSKFWQSRWEFKLALIEAKVAPQSKLFRTTKLDARSDVKAEISKNEINIRWYDYIFLPSLIFKLLLKFNNWLILCKFSVSTIMMVLSLLFIGFYSVILYLLCGLETQAQHAIVFHI